MGVAVANDLSSAVEYSVRLGSLCGKELQTNVLADRLGKLVQGFREGFAGRPSNTSLLIWGGIAVALVLIVGWKIYSNGYSKSFGIFAQQEIGLPEV